MLKKILKITGITLLALVVILFAAPLLFKGKILTLVKSSINENINAKVDFADVSLSFFRHFPKVSLALEDIHVAGIDEFAKDTLISAREIDVAVDLFSVIGGKDMKVHAVNIHEPRIHALVNKEGKANWDIVKPDTSTATTEEATPFKLQLKAYSIEDGYVYYNDASAGMSAEVFHLNHEGSGDFTSDLFTLETETKADAVSFNYGGIPYIAQAKTAISTGIQVDNKTNTYSFKTDELNLNELKVATEGFFRLVDDSTYDMDIKFKAPSTEFKNILSLVPAIYQKDFEQLKTSGKAIFDGFVKGRYSSSQIPAYTINLGIQDGFFQYPDLPKAVKNINLQLNVTNPDGVTDNTVVHIPKAHIEFGNDPFDFHLLLKKPMTDRYIDAGVKGTLDLAGITQFIKLEPGTKLSGMVQADAEAKGNLAVIQQQKPGPFSAKGFMDIQKLHYSSKDFPQPIQNTNAKILMNSPDGVTDNVTIQIPSAHIEVGKDAVDLTLLLKTLASDPYFDGTAKGSFNLANVAQFYAFEPGTSLAGILNANVSFKGKKSFIDKSQYEAIQTAGTVNATNIAYQSKDYPDGVTLKTTQLTFTPRNVTASNVAGNFMQTNFNANGSFDNLIGYAMKDEPLAGTLNVSADKVDLNKWMATESTEADTTMVAGDPFAVPKNLQLTLHTKVDEVKYDKVIYKNINGALHISDETARLKNVQMQALDGTILLNGFYSTLNDKKNPDVSFAYDVQNLDVEKTFMAFNTVQKLMPVGKFIAGKLTSKMSMKGKLGQDMMPDLSTLTGAGNLFLIEGLLSKFQPLEKLAGLLDINELKQISVKDIKSYFEFANGKVLVKPFNVSVKDVDMEIGGMHGFDQSINYVINLKVPRSKLGNKANQLADNLAVKAASKGVPIKLSEFINLKVNMEGTITNPSIKTDMAQAGSSIAEDMKEQANVFVEAKKAAADSAIAAAKSAAKDSLQSAKKQVINSAAEELRKQIGGQKDTTGTASPQETKKKVEESAKGLLKGILNKKKGTDTTGKK